MSILEGLKTNEDVKDEKDSLGNDFSPFKSGVHDFTISKAFITLSKGKAMAVNIHAKDADDKELRHQLWVTSGEAKGCKNYYTNKDGDKHYLPGFNIANAICLLSVGKQLANLKTEKKIIKLYSPKDRAEAPTNVDMIMDLIGQKISLGIIERIVNKQAKNDATNEYEDTNEERSINEIDKVFRTKDGFTVTEIKAQAEEAVFITQWKEKWEGNVDNRFKKVEGSGVAQGLPSAQADSTNAAKTEELFA